MGFFSRLKGGYKDIASAISGWFTGKGSGTWLDMADLDDYVAKNAGIKSSIAMQQILQESGNLDGFKNAFEGAYKSSKMANPDVFKKAFADMTQKMTDAGVDPAKTSFIDFMNPKTAGQTEFAKSLEAYRAFKYSDDKVQMAKTLLGRDDGFTMLDRYNMFFGRGGDIGRGRRNAVRTTMAGGMVGGRLLSGGSLTHDKNGNRDIVGILFV